MPDQTVYSIEELRNVKSIDLGDGSFALAVAQAGGSANAVTAATVSVTTSRQQLTSVTGTFIKLKAPIGNTASVYVGGADASSTNGYPLAPGEDTDWMAMSNLSALYYISAYSGQSLSYIVLV
jgi:hypothetical protein